MIQYKDKLIISQNCYPKKLSIPQKCLHGFSFHTPPSILGLSSLSFGAQQPPFSPISMHPSHLHSCLQFFTSFPLKLRISPLSFCTTQQNYLRSFVKAIPEAAIFLEWLCWTVPQGGLFVKGRSFAPLWLLIRSFCTFIFPFVIRALAIQCNLVDFFRRKTGFESYWCKCTFELTCFVVGSSLYLRGYN